MNRDHHWAMNLRDYFLGIEIDLVSPLPPDQVAERINEATPSMWNISASGVGGWCRLGRLRLHWRTPYFSNGFAPILSARMRGEMGRTAIAGGWGAPFFTRIWFGLWTLLSSLALASVVAGLLGAAPWNEAEYLMLVILPLFFSVPFGAALLSIRKGDERMTEVVKFLEDVAKAKPN